MHSCIDGTWQKIRNVCRSGDEIWKHVLCKCPLYDDLQGLSGLAMVQSGTLTLVNWSIRATGLITVGFA